MKKIALTGGIACGKSYVASRFRQAGIPVVDADLLAREAVKHGSSALAAIVARFGSDVLTGDGVLDRARVASIVFGDADARRALEAIVHPAVRRATADFFAGLPVDTPLAVAEIPLLYETQGESRFDAVIVVACREEQQIERLMQRTSLSRAEAAQRIASQWPTAAKVARADHVIRTDGSLADTDAQVEGLIRAFTS